MKRMLSPQGTPLSPIVENLGDVDVRDREITYAYLPEFAPPRIMRPRRRFR
jgi:hypothetical protein